MIEASWTPGGVEWNNDSAQPVVLFVKDVLSFFDIWG